MKVCNVVYIHQDLITHYLLWQFPLSFTSPLGKHIRFTRASRRIHFVSGIVGPDPRSQGKKRLKLKWQLRTVRSKKGRLSLPRNKTFFCLFFLQLIFVYLSMTVNFSPSFFLKGWSIMPSTVFNLPYEWSKDTLFCFLWGIYSLHTCINI